MICVPRSSMFLWSASWLGVRPTSWQSANPWSGVWSGGGPRCVGRVLPRGLAFASSRRKTFERAVVWRAKDRSRS